MNREIKFRVWDKSLNEFFTDDNTWKISNKQQCHDDYQSSCERFFCGLEEIKNNDNLIIQQFTGLRDKNGKEIYEGDVLEESWIESALGFPSSRLLKNNYIVKWEDIGFNISIGWPTIGSVHCSEHQLKIIGNIFENPDLLK